MERTDLEVFLLLQKIKLAEWLEGKIDYNVRSRFLRLYYYETRHWKRFSFWRRHWWFGVTFLGWGKCSDCKSRDGLECHHVSYDHCFFEQFFWFDLVNLCHKCHQKRHSLRYQGWRTTT